MTAARHVAMEAPRRVDPARRAVYEKAGDLPSLADEAASMARHAAAARALADLGEAALARGAAQVATVTALRLATTSVRTRREHEAKVGALVDFVAATREPDRSHVAALLDAAVWAEAEQRLAVGLRSHASRSVASEDGVDGRAAKDVLLPRPHRITTSDLTCYVEAEAARDVDVILSTTIEVLRDLVALPKGVRATAGAWAMVEGAAFNLCARPAASVEEKHDVRRTLLILWRTLRRRRPAAAVLRRRLALDRARWPGPVR